MRRLGSWAQMQTRTQPEQTVQLPPSLSAPSPHSRATPSGVAATTGGQRTAVAPSSFSMPISTMESQLGTAPAQQWENRPEHAGPYQPGPPAPIPQMPGPPDPEVGGGPFGPGPRGGGRPNTSPRGAGRALDAPGGGMGGMGGSGYAPGAGPAGGRPNSAGGGARNRLEAMLPPGLQGRVAPGQLERLLAEMMGGSRNRGPGPNYNLRQKGEHGYGWSGMQGAQARGGAAIGSRGGSRGQGGTRSRRRSQNEKERRTY